MVSNTTVEAVKDYQKEANQANSEIMFPGGLGDDPSNKWVKRVQQYYKRKLDMHVQTHNVRKTAITEYYNHSKDIVATQKWVGHSDIKIT